MKYSVQMHGYKLCHISGSWGTFIYRGAQAGISPLHMECDGRGWSVEPHSLTQVMLRPVLGGMGDGMGMVSEPSWGLHMSSKRHSEGIPYD